MCSTGVVDRGQGLSRNRHSPVLMLLNHLASASWQRCIEAIAYVIREADERDDAVILDSTSCSTSCFHIFQARVFHRSTAITR